MKDDNRIYGTKIECDTTEIDRASKKVNKLSKKIKELNFELRELSSFFNDTNILFPITIDSKEIAKVTKDFTDTFLTNLYKHRKA